MLGSHNSSITFLSHFPTFCQSKNVKGRLTFQGTEINKLYFVDLKDLVYDAWYLTEFAKNSLSDKNDHFSCLITLSHI